MQSKKFILSICLFILTAFFITACSDSNSSSGSGSIEQKVTKVVMNDYTRYALFQNGSLFAWSSNQYGLLSLRLADTKITTPQKITNINGFITNLVVNKLKFSVFAFTADNSLYTWGDNQYGQLGLGDLENRYAFEKVNGYTGNINKIYSNFYCTYMLTDDNSIYDCGSNAYGELGLGDDVNKFSPEKVNNISGTIKDIFANGEQVYLLMEDDSIYSWEIMTL